MAFCGCFRPQAKYECPAEAVQVPQSHVARPYARDQQQQQVAAQPITPVQPDVINNNFTADVPQYQPAPAEHVTPVAAKLASHNISISPAGERDLSSPDGSEQAADVVRQSNVDAVKTISPKKALQMNELLATQQYQQQPAAAAAAAGFGADTAAAGTADAGAKKAAGSSEKTKAGKTGAAAKMANTTPNGKKTPWGARTPPSAAAAHAHTTPVRGTPPSKAAAGAPITPSSGPSPSVIRPTCASVARAQAVSASKPVVTNAGSWKL